MRTIACRGHCTHLLPEVPMEYALCHGSHTCYWCSRIVNRGTCHWEMSKPGQARANREQIHSAADAGRPSPAPTISASLTTSNMVLQDGSGGRDLPFAPWQDGTVGGPLLSGGQRPLKLLASGVFCRGAVGRAPPRHRQGWAAVL